MGDVQLIVKRLGLGEHSKGVAAKASEYVRVATARLGAGGLGQFELCKGAACVELACMTLGVTVDAALVQRFSCVSDKVYHNTKVALQKVLGVTSKATARELCIQFGCARHDQSVRAALAAFKERFVKSLPAVQQGHVDFGRPVFLAAAFYMVARKHKVQVDRAKLLGPLGVTATEFAQVTASMADLCGDLVGDGRKRKAEEVAEERRALIDCTGAAEEDEASDSEDEVEEQGQVGHRLNAKKQRQREYEAWKEKVIAKPAAGSGSSSIGGGAASKQEKLTEKKLRQATLSFAVPPPAAAAGPSAAAAAAAAAADPAADAGGGARVGNPAAEPQQQLARSSSRSKAKKTAAKPSSSRAGKKAALGAKNS